MIWKILLTIAFIGIIGLLAMILFKSNGITYITNVTTITIENNTVINITTILNTTKEKQPVVVSNPFGDGITSSVVS